MRVWRVQKWVKRVIPTRYWGRRPTWVLACQDKATGTSLILHLTQLPEGLTEGDQSSAPMFTVAGLFFKIVEQRGKGTKPGEKEVLRQYPVLVADTLYRAETRGPWDDLPFSTAVIVALVVVLLLAFIFIKRRAAGRRDRFARQYRPLRDTSADEKATGAADGTKADDPVDEELLRQLRQYKAEHGQEETE